MIHKNILNFVVGATAIVLLPISARADLCRGLFRAGDNYLAQVRLLTKNRGCAEFPQRRDSSWTDPISKFQQNGAPLPAAIVDEGGGNYLIKFCPETYKIAATEAECTGTAAAPKTQIRAIE